MHISVIVAHPDPHSFNHAIARAAVAKLRENGHQVLFHDLYAEKFDPILPSHEIPKDVPLPPEIEAHCRELSSAHGIIIVHPNWWGQPPAILKGWVDRVIRPGVAYEFIEGDSGEGRPDALIAAECDPRAGIEQEAVGKVVLELPRIVEGEREVGLKATDDTGSREPGRVPGRDEECVFDPESRVGEVLRPADALKQA